MPTSRRKARKARKPKGRKVASLMVVAPGAMTYRERRDVAAWLHQNARLVAKGKRGGAKLAVKGRYTASFTFY